MNIAIDPRFVRLDASRPYTGTTSTTVPAKAMDTNPENSVDGFGASQAEALTEGLRHRYMESLDNIREKTAAMIESFHSGSYPFKIDRPNSERTRIESLLS